MVARLPEWIFDMEQLQLCTSSTIAASDQPTALCNALTQLNTHLNTPAPVIQLPFRVRPLPHCWWAFTDGVIHTIATALPADSTLRLCVEVNEQLTDTVLSQVQRMGTRVCQLEVVECSVEQALSMAWPVLHVHRLSIGRLTGGLQSTAPAAHKGARRNIHVHELILEGTLTQVRGPCA